MRLLFYISSMRAGGAERVMSVLCNGFAERGNDVYLATNTEAPISYRLDEKVHLLDLYPHGYKDMNRYVRFVSLYRSVHRIARRVKPDVIIAFYGDGHQSILGYPGTVYSGYRFGTYHL